MAKCEHDSIELQEILPLRSKTLPDPSVQDQSTEWYEKIEDDDTSKSPTHVQDSCDHGEKQEKEKQIAKLSLLSKWPWTHILTVLCLWLAYFLCNLANSLLGPFYPQEVS